MMQSLRARLFVVLLATILLFWGTALAGFFLYRTREHTGRIDAMLREAGNSLVLATRANADALPAAEPLRLPAGTSFSGEKLSYQAWGRGGKNLMRSAGSPAVPLRADFADGFADQEIDGVAWHIFAISDADGRVHVQVGKRQSEIDAELRRIAGLSLATALLVFALLAVAIWSVVRWSLRPVTEVQSAVQQRLSFDLTPLPAAKLPLEVRPLVESFNGLLEQLDQAVRHERRFIADAAHELRTPLAAMLAHAQVALRADNLREKNAALLQLSAALERGARLSEQLLDMARLDAGHTVDRRAQTPLHELIEVVVRDFEAAAHRRRQHISLEIEACVIRGDTDELGILARNLIHNALRYTGQGGRIAVSCASARRSAKRAVCLKISDNGPGVPEGERERIFERFYRVPANGGRGSGIGLSLVARIAQSHGATIEPGSGLDDRGLSISVWFDDPTQETDAALPDPRSALFSKEVSVYR
jgi:signal transduction histidine kinase